MFKFLAFLVLLVFLGILIFGIFLGKIIRFFGPTDKNRSSGRQQQNSHQNTSNTPPKKFPKEEGEYISYEEIKEEE